MPRSARWDVHGSLDYLLSDTMRSVGSGGGRRGSASGGAEQSLLYERTDRPTTNRGNRRERTVGWGRRGIRLGRALKKGKMCQAGPLPTSAPPSLPPSSLLSDLLRPLENHRETVTMLSAAAATRASGHSSITYARWMGWPVLPHLFMLHAQGLLRE